MAELHIPDEAVRATYRGELTENVTNRQIEEILRLGAPLVVAAELRRLRRILADRPSFMSLHVLAERADELDPRADEIEGSR